jgi:hypothetical protein
MAAGPVYFQAAAPASVPDQVPAALALALAPALAAEAALVAVVVAAPVAAAAAVAPAAAAALRAGLSPLSVPGLSLLSSLLTALPGAVVAAARSLRVFPRAPRFRSRRTARGRLSAGSG